MSGEKILVIDDRRENLLFLADSVLRPEGYEVITALDGKEGLEKARAEKPDLIITDLKMPRMSGLELIAALRRENIPSAVILTTFYGSEQAAIQAFRLGVKDYIVKPYEIKEMLESVERALVEQRLRRETKHLQEGIELSRHLEERVRQLHSLCNIGKALTALHDPEEVMRVSVEAAIYLTDAASGQLFLISPATQQVEIRAVRGPSDLRAMCIQQVGADPATLQVIRTGKAIVTGQDGGARERTSRLIVPLRTKDKVIGALGVDTKPNRPFSENDRYLLGVLADFVGVAWTNTQLIQELRDRTSAQPEPPIQPPDRPAGSWSATDLDDSIAEAERLSQELRNLAAAAQVLAARLQVISQPRGT